MARSIKKGPFIEKKLYKKILDMKKAGNSKMIKTYSRTSTIIPEMVGLTLSVYNGKAWVPVYVTENLVATSSASLLPPGCLGDTQAPIEKSRGRGDNGSEERV